MQLTDPTLHPVFIVYLLDKQEPDWVSLGPSELRRRIGSVSSENWNKIQAAKTALACSAPFDDFRMFSHVVRALNGTTVDFTTLPPPGVLELVGGAQMLHLLGTTQQEGKEFAEEIYQYSGAVSDFHAAGPLPEPLKKSGRYVKVPVQDPGVAEAANEYIGSLNALLMQQLGQ